MEATWASRWGPFNCCCPAAAFTQGPSAHLHSRQIRGGAGARQRGGATTQRRQVQEQEQQQRPGQHGLGVHVTEEVDRGCGRGCCCAVCVCVEAPVSRPRGPRALSGVLGQSRPFIPVLGARQALPSGVISHLSVAFRPAELRRGNAPLRVRDGCSLGVEAGESRPCIEMGLAGDGSARGTPTGASPPASSLPAKISGS